MSTVQDYASRLGDPASQRFETFSYLPAMSADEIRRQVQYVVDRGWNPAIEHCAPSQAGQSYWYMWKLPMFGETDVDRILGEAEACRQANPGHLVKLIGYDNAKQSQGTAMLIFRPAA